MESIWIREYLVSRQRDCLPLSSVCNLRCVFCSNCANPFTLPPPEHRKYDDVMLNLQALEEEEGKIQLCDNIPGRIGEGESLLHPKFFEILDQIRMKFPRTRIILRSNGTMLTEDFVSRLAAFKPIEFDTLSINSADNGKWRKITGGSARMAGKAIESLPILAANAIPFIPSLVALPAVTGWEDIEKTVAYCAEQGAEALLIWHPGFSRFMDKKTCKLLECDYEQLHANAARLAAKYHISIRITPGKIGPRSFAYFQRIVMKSRNDLKYLWLASEAASKGIEQAVKTSPYGNPDNHFICMTKNHTYGGNIIVAGLLMVSDFIKAGEKWIDTHGPIDQVLIPRAPFDALGRDLLYNPYFKIAEALKASIMLI